MEREKALSIIDTALAKLPQLRGGRCHSPEHIEFIQTTGIELERIFGPDSPVTRNFSSLTYQPTESVLTSMLTYETDIARAEMKAYLHGLNIAEGVLRSARNQLEQHGVDRILSESRIRSEGACVFISHGKETPALTKVERFIRVLGLRPVIVVREPSEGMSVDDLVDKRMSESGCVVILATADDEISGYRQPRPNVIHEIGLAQEKFGKRVIYLKEASCEFPSNVRPKVWENFTQDNMEAAFEKISKELRAFGLL